MSYVVNTYNTDSGWMLGSIYSAESTAEGAIADAGKHWGVTGLNNFRHVVIAQDESELPATPLETAENTPEVTATPVEVAEDKVREDTADSILKDLQGVDHSVLAKVFAKLNSALGG